MLETIIGFDIGGSKIGVIEGDYQAAIYQRAGIADHVGQPIEITFRAMCAAADEIRAGAQTAGRTVRAISVSIGGPLDIERGIIMSPPNLPGCDNIPLKAMLAEHCGLPVYVEHDGNAGALVECYFGAGLGKRNLIFLTLGTGLGAGIIIDGKVYRGSTASHRMARWLMVKRGVGKVCAAGLGWLSWRICAILDAGRTM